MNENKPFSAVATVPGSEKYENCIQRDGQLRKKKNFDSRTEFERDYTRILHCLAYRRLKHKTQVFFNIGNDHICTRMEHVGHVESVSTTIAKALGLNIELTRAMAIGHDLGHAPFGHEGEKILNRLSVKYLGTEFFHERNGLHFVDDIELLEDEYRVSNNLYLTYGVRDGIISHCGEVDDNSLRPRDEYIDLTREFVKPGQYSPYTWEGCCVKLADKIAYVGRDVEDAIRLHFLNDDDITRLNEIAGGYGGNNVVNTTSVINNIIYDVTANSSPDTGLCLSPDSSRMLNEIKNFNLEYIYRNPLLTPFTAYADLVLNQLFDLLLSFYDTEATIYRIKKAELHYPALAGDFSEWLLKYCDSNTCLNFSCSSRTEVLNNKKIYGGLETKELYVSAILDFLSGMSDNYAIRLFNELITY